MIRGAREGREEEQDDFMQPERREFGLSSCSWIWWGVNDSQRTGRAFAQRTPSLASGLQPQGIAGAGDCQGAEAATAVSGRKMR